MDNSPNEVFLRYRALQGQHTFVDEAVQFIVNLLDLFNFQNDQLYLTFNGGKDATVVLYLTVIALESTCRMKSRQKIKTIYFEESNPFREVDEFLRFVGVDVRNEHQNILSSISGVDRKQGLADLKRNTQVKAVLMGTRSTDPYADKLEKISLTDQGYPIMLRLNPILYWSFEQVWIFLREYNIPYCKLYDEGYTYLGNQTNTQPNPHLKNEDNSYRPAWEAEGSHELFSRTPKQEVKD